MLSYKQRPQKQKTHPSSSEFLDKTPKVQAAKYRIHKWTYQNLKNLCLKGHYQER